LASVLAAAFPHLRRRRAWAATSFAVLLSAAGLADIPPALARLQRHVNTVNRRVGYALQLSA
jgi:hypothetical protein